MIVRTVVNNENLPRIREQLGSQITEEVSAGDGLTEVRYLFTWPAHQLMQGYMAREWYAPSGVFAR